MSSLGNREIFARNLSHYIEKSGRTQKEISEIVGVSTSTFNDWVKGKKYPRIDKVEMLAEYFGILKSDLIEEKREQPTEYDGLSDAKKMLIEFAKNLPEDKVQLALRLLRSVAETD